MLRYFSQKYMKEITIIEKAFKKYLKYKHQSPIEEIYRKFHYFYNRIWTKDLKSSLNEIYLQVENLRSEKLNKSTKKINVVDKSIEIVRRKIPKPKTGHKEEKYNVTIDKSKVVIMQDNQNFESPSVSKISINSDRKWSGSDQCEKETINDEFFDSLLKEPNLMNSPISNFNVTVQPNNVHILKIYQDSRRSTYIFAEGEDEEEEAAKFRVLSFAKRNSRMSFLNEQKV